MFRPSAIPSRPRVLFAIGGLSPVGGSESQVVEVMTHLHGQAIDATLVTARASNNGVLRDRLDELGIPIVTIGAGDVHRLLHPPLMAARYARILGRIEPHVVYPWLEETSLFLVPLARCLGVRSVVARRSISGAEVERIPAAKRAIRSAEAMADLVTANSQAVLDQAEWRGIDPSKLRLVRNAHPDLPPLPMPEGPPVIGYLANFRPGKGHSRFVDALAQLPRDISWEARLGGDGVTLPSVRARVDQLGLHGRVRFLGRIDDSRDFWGRCHIAALFSDHEGSPNALIEGGFAGRPIVATRVGGIPEIVEDGVGWLVGLGNDPTTRTILTRLLTDPALCRETGRRAHRHVSQRFSMRESVDGHLAVIEEALAA